MCVYSKIKHTMPERVRSWMAHWAHEELRCTRCGCTTQLLAAPSPIHERRASTGLKFPWHIGLPFNISLHHIQLKFPFNSNLTFNKNSLHRLLIIFVKLHRSAQKVISVSVAFRSFTAEAVFVSKVLIHATIVLFGIWVFFCEFYAPVVLVWGQKSDLHIYIYCHTLFKKLIS